MRVHTASAERVYFETEEKPDSGGPCKFETKEEPDSGAASTVGTKENPAPGGKSKGAGEAVSLSSGDADSASRGYHPASCERPVSVGIEEGDGQESLEQPSANTAILWLEGLRMPAGMALADVLGQR